MNDTHEELRELITELVTGSGEQMENLSMSDEEWEETLQKITESKQGDVDNFPIALTFDLWMRLIEVARNHTGTYPEEDK